MAVPYELFNFLTKFNNLSRCGQDAHLSIESQYGNIYLNLQLRLPNFQPPQECQQQNQQKPRRCTPSRQRRRARRAKARAEAAETNENSPSYPRSEAAEQVAAKHAETSEVAIQTTFTVQTTEEAAVQAVVPSRESAVQAVLSPQEAAVQVVLPYQEAAVQAVELGAQQATILSLKIDVERKDAAIIEKERD